MKRTFFACFAALAVASSASALCAAPSPSPAPKDACASKPSKWERTQCENFTHSAPGDAYFGRMKLSFLGIDNTYHDEAIRAGDYTTDSNIISKVGFADEALDQWAKSYPGDPQLARSYYLAIVVHKKIWTEAMQQKAWSYMQLLLAHFSTTYFGKVVKADITTNGFTERWFGAAQPCAASGSSPTPSPTPSPSSPPGQPKIQVIDPPCISATSAP